MTQYFMFLFLQISGVLVSYCSCLSVENHHFKKQMTVKHWLWSWIVNTSSHRMFHSLVESKFHLGLSLQHYNNLLEWKYCTHNQLLRIKPLKD